MPAANHVFIPCTLCRKKVKRTKHHLSITKNHFCGFRCYGHWQRIHRIGVGRKRIKIKCLKCGRTKSIQPCQYEHSKRHFCNPNCYWQWRRDTSFNSGPSNVTWKGGGVSYRGPNWIQQSRAAKKRDNNTCQHCHLQRKGHPVHHIRPFRLFEGDYKTANSLDNLITLCGFCHGKAEQKFWKDNPQLSSIAPFPLFPTKTCRKCCIEFRSRSGAATVCDECCQRTCTHCGIRFYRRKSIDTEKVYCSKSCWGVSHNNPRSTNSRKT